MPRRLTTKQKAFIAAYIANGGNGTQAALTAYPSITYDTADATARDNLGKPRIREAVEKAGISITRVLKRVSEALDATGPEGQEDHHVRLRAADMSLKLHDAYPRDRKSEDESRRPAIDITSYQSLPIEVIRFRAMTGRWPTEEEKAQLVAGNTLTTKEIA